MNIFNAFDAKQTRFSEMACGIARMPKRSITVHEERAFGDAVKRSIRRDVERPTLTWQCRWVTFMQTHPTQDCISARHSATNQSGQIKMERRS